MHGIVSKLSVKKGERAYLVLPRCRSTEMLRIADGFKVKWRCVNVNENDIVRVHLNDTTLIDVDAMRMTGNSSRNVTNIAEYSKNKTSTTAITEFEVQFWSSILRIRIWLQNRYPFRPGMTASVEILTNRKTNVMSVPLSAVTTHNPDDENKPRRWSERSAEQQ